MAPESNFLEKYGLWVTLLVLGGTGLILTAQYGFIGPDEPRYARIAQEMLERRDWVVPTLEGIPWLEKPPLLYWLTGISYWLLGVSEFAARIPSVLAGLATMIAVWRMIRLRRGSRPAVHAAFILGTSLLYLGYTGAGTTDMLFTACLTGTLAGMLRILEEEPAPWSSYLATGFFLGLACLAKGPLALLIPGLTIAGYRLRQGPIPGLRTGRLLAAGFVLVATALPWYWLMYMREGFYFILVFFINHHLARFFTSIHHHSHPFWYYLPVLAIGFMPWTLFLPSWRLLRDRLRHPAASPEARLQLFALGWLLLPLIFFSLSEAKLPGYILPLFPPLAILTALNLEHYLSGDRPIPPSIKIAATLFTAGLAAALPWLLEYRYGLLATGLILCAAGLPAAAALLWGLWKNRPAVAFPSLALSLILPLLIYGPVLLRQIEPFHSNREICRQAMKFTNREQPLIIFRNFHHTSRYYTDYTCTQNFESLAKLMNYLPSRSSPSYLLTEQEGWEDLKRLPGWKMQIILRAGWSRLVRLEKLE